MRTVLIALLALAGFACPAAQPPLDIEVTDAWIRWLPADVPGAGYMTLANRGATAQTLVGASSRDYAAITLHQTRAAQGLRGMTLLDSLRIEAGTTIKFADLGYHWMLAPGVRRVHRGDRVTITLLFAGDRSMIVPFEVRADGN